MSLDELAEVAKSKAFFVPEEVAGVLGCGAHYIRLQARADPEALGFPVVVIGHRTKIPAVPFLRFMGKEV